MKFTFSIRSLIDDMLADSALNALVSDRIPLSDDHSSALCRTMIHAAAEVAAEMASCLLSVSFPDSDNPDSSIVFEIDDSSLAAPQALKIYLADCLSFACLRLLAIATSDTTRSHAYAACLDGSLKALRECIECRRSYPTIRPSYR